MALPLVNSDFRFTDEVPNGVHHFTFRFIEMKQKFVVPLLLMLTMSGCGRGTAEVDQPMRYDSTAALKARLLEVSQYGDGGSSLGGIPESIEELTKSDPELGKKLLSDFQRLNTTDSKEERKMIAKEMADELE